MRSLVIGRFQPFHLGHLDLVRQAAQKGEVIIAVTSSQFNYLEKDPFTAGERIEMIRAALDEAGINAAEYLIIPVANVPNVAVWVPYLKTMLPAFDAVYTGNEYVRMLFEMHGIRVVQPELVDRESLEGTGIRQLMLDGGDWQRLVPPAVSKLITMMGGRSRLVAIKRSQANPVEY